MPSVALSFQSVTIEYRNGKHVTRAVDSFSLDVQKGEFIGLLGPNGAGKTSLISAASSLIPFQAGSISVFGQPAGSVEAKRMLGVVPQELVSHGFFSVNEILHFTAGYYGLSPKQRKVDEILDKLQLAPYKNRLVAELSGGMKRRLLIAKALIHQPKVLLLDEPSAGVDVELRTLLWDYMKELNQSGVTIVLTTHYLEEAQRLCERSAILNHGKLIALDETGAMIRAMSERVIQVTMKDEKKVQNIKAKPEKGVPVITVHKGKIRALVAGTMSLKEVLDAIDIRLDDIKDLETEEGDLEHAFLKLVKNGGVYGAK